jgi:hypothetical protein
LAAYWDDRTAARTDPDWVAEKVVRSAEQKAGLKAQYSAAQKALLLVGRLADDLAEHLAQTLVAEKDELSAVASAVHSVVRKVAAWAAPTVQLWAAWKDVQLVDHSVVWSALNWANQLADEMAVLTVGWSADRSVERSADHLAVK